MKKYSQRFERDFKWLLKMRHIFHFDGASDYTKNGLPVVVPDINGVSGKEAFYYWDTNGVAVPTRHPNVFYALLKTKGSINLHIKMYAEDRASGCLPLIEFRAMCMKWKAPDWFYFAVENQKHKHYEKMDLPEWFKAAASRQKERYKLGLKH